MPTFLPEALSGRVRELRAIGDVSADLPAHCGLAITGEPGMGKSTLIRAAGPRARRDGVRVMAISPVPEHRDQPGAVLRPEPGPRGTAIKLVTHV